VTSQGRHHVPADAEPYRPDFAFEGRGVGDDLRRPNLVKLSVDLFVKKYKYSGGFSS
jgi:hypothetical protein